MRNLKSCLKVALDFVSPETVGAALAMADELRTLPGAHAGRARNANTQVRLMLLHAAHTAVHSLDAATNCSSE